MLNVLLLILYLSLVYGMVQLAHDYIFNLFDYT